MATFLIPQSPGSDRAVRISASADGAELLQLAKLQFAFSKSHPEVFCRPRLRAGKSHDNSARWYRVALDIKRASGSRVMPRFTLSSGARAGTLKVLGKHWTECGIPWVRIYQDGGGSELLPDCSWNDHLSAA